MKIQFLLQGAFYLLYLLIVLFCIIDIPYSFIFFLSIFTIVFTIKIYEFILFHLHKDSFIKLGKHKVFNPILRSICIFLFLALVSWGLQSNFGLIQFNSKFSKIFYFGIFIAVIIKDLIFQENLYYFSGNNIITYGNYFPKYKISDFKKYIIIENQDLIGLQKQNNNFLFIEYDAFFFTKNKKAIIKKLDLIKHKDNG